MDVTFDTSEIRKIRSIFDSLPREIKHKAMARALSRMRSMAKTQIVRRSAEKVGLAQKYIRPVVKTTTSFSSAETLEFLIRSGWVRLIDMSPTGTPKGVVVKGRRMKGSYEQAFIATIKRDEAVFSRVSKGDGARVGRGPVQELFAANIANAIHQDEAYFEKVLSDLLVERLEPRLLHEIENLLRPR